MSNRGNCTVTGYGTLSVLLQRVEHALESVFKIFIINRSTEQERGAPR